MLPELRHSSIRETVPSYFELVAAFNAPVFKLFSVSTDEVTSVISSLKDMTNSSADNNGDKVFKIVPMDPISYFRSVVNVGMRV